MSYATKLTLSLKYVKDISRVLGEWWRAEPEEQKTEYKKRSADLKTAQIVKLAEPDQLE